MACIDDFLTYQGSDINPTSGLYVNNLYGVNLSKIDAVANTDYASGIEFINEKIRMAIIYVSTELKRYVMPYFKLNSVIAHYKGGRFDKDLEYHSSVAANKGLRVDLLDTTLSQILINRVTVLADSTGDFNVVVKDGEDVTNYAVSLLAGEQSEVNINKYCDSIGSNVTA